MHSFHLCELSPSRFPPFSLQCTQQKNIQSTTIEKERKRTSGAVIISELLFCMHANLRYNTRTQKLINTFIIEYYYAEGVEVFDLLLSNWRKTFVKYISSSIFIHSLSLSQFTHTHTRWKHHFLPNLWPYRTLFYMLMH